MPSDNLADRAGERGSMLVEASFLLVLIVIPMVYLIATVGQLQAGAYAASAAAREAGRTFATSAEPQLAPGRAVAAAQLVFSAHGFDQGEGTVNLSCPTGMCLEPGSTVQIEAQVQVALPLMPDFVRHVLPTYVTMSAEHLEAVDEYRGAP